MSVIQVGRLTKTFRVKVKDPGFSGSLRSIVHPKYQEIAAVQEASFSVEEGEMIAFIGPNGAGKSTTIKMLTGILHPTSGEARVLGRIPWRERHKLSFEIGSVFGQKSQLWFHLPPIDTFHLLGKVYEIPSAALRRRIEELVETFALADILKIPVRRLSLGQRMRCEIAASFLHRPKIVFLDEPTIGLDVVAKQRIRDLIRTMNREEGTTILLTSHDTGDIEQLCKRVMVINSGTIILDTSVRRLKQDFISEKIVDLKVGTPIDRFASDGVDIVKQSDYGLKLKVDTSKRPIGDVMAEVVRRFPVVDVTVSDPPLEEIISQIYEREAPYSAVH